MPKYICKKTFEVDTYDEDGCYAEGSMEIEVGMQFEVSDSPYRFAGGPDTIRLESEDGTWLELLPETINEYFEVQEV